MPEFSYTASDLEGQIVSGVIEAKDRDEALRTITQMGLLRPRLVTGKMSSSEADEFATKVGDAAGSDLPLADALRAAAMEIDRPKLRAALQRLAKIVNDGNSLDAALVRLDDVIPTPTAALLSASARSGAIAHVLPEIIEQRKSVRMIWAELLMLVSYPLIVLYAAMLLFAMFGVLIVAPFKEMFEDFGIQIPAMTMAIIWWHDVGAWCLLGFLTFITVALIFGRLVVSAARRRQLLAWTPIIGPIIHWTGVSEMASTLALMLESNLPMNEAVRYTGMSSEDFDIQLACEHIERDIEAGIPLSEAMQRAPEIPPTIVPLVQWGERDGSIPKSLRSYTVAIGQRVRNRGRLLRLVLPLVILLGVGTFIGFAIVALFLPLMTLVQGLA